jgi:dTDP-4-amino-4,6-dideoxygalactose transaminase
MMLNRPLIIIGHTSLITDAEDLALENLVYLPAYPAMRGKDRNKLTQLLIDFSSLK